MHPILLSLILSTLLAALALWRKALTLLGLALAWVCALVITYCGGAVGFAALAATFVFTILAGKLSRRVRETVEKRIHAHRGPRNILQVFCNVFVGALMLLLRRLSGNDGFLWAYAGAMAASLSDSLASELGVLSRRQPRDILSGRIAEKGLSGAVSPLGLLCSALGALLIAALCAPFWGSWGMLLSVTAAGFLAALADSVLGSCAQAKYRCTVCGTLMEKPVCCSRPARLERGFAYMTNDAVNFLNNLVGALIALGAHALFSR